MEVRVKNIIDETPAVKRFTLQANDDSMLPPFSGGSHITTFLPQPAGGVLERNYSLFNTTSEPGVYEIAVRLAEDSKGGSQFWHENVQVGDVLTVSWPKNQLPLSFRAKHHVFYAAGIGITPFLSMMADLLVKGGSFELHYAAKTQEQCAFYDYLQKTYPSNCYFYFSKGDEPKRLSPIYLLHHRIGTHVYVCGPETFIHDFKKAAMEYGYPSFNVHFERFSAPGQHERHPFVVNLLKSKVQLDIPADHSLLEVLHQNGIYIPYSCRVGGCGTCEVKVAEGNIQHFDSFLTEEQQQSNQTMLCCVSRGIGRVVLDL